MPFNSWITPTLTVEGGHYFSGNANSAVRNFVNLDTDKAILKDFNYDFFNAHLGLEIGSTVFAFYLRGGESYVVTTLQNVKEFVQTAPQPGSTNFRVTSAQPAHASYRGPSVKLGFVVYFM